MRLIEGTARWALDKNRYKPRICFPSLRLAFHSSKPYESELSTALSECKAVARCATRKTDAAINRDKPLAYAKPWTLGKQMRR